MKGQLKKIFGAPASLENVKKFYSIKILLLHVVEEEEIFVVKEEEISKEQLRNQNQHLLI